MGALNYTQAMAMIPSIRQCIKTTAEGLLHYGITKSLTISTIQNIAIQPIWSIALRTYQVPTEAGNQLLGAIGSLARALNDGIYADAADLAQKYKRAKVSVSTPACRRFSGADSFIRCRALHPGVWHQLT